MKLINKPLVFTEDSIKKIEETKEAKWVIDTEYQGILCSVFYQENPPSGMSNYFALYSTVVNPHEVMDGKEAQRKFMITDGSWITKLEITGIEAANGDVIMSHYRHHMNYSEDGSVFIDGGNAYTRYGGSAPNLPERLCKIKITGPNVEL